ncbi:MAG: hypothetical protein ACRD2T_08745, partial [Thermoanaerobaculia bacterium]
MSTVTRSQLLTRTAVVIAMAAALVAGYPAAGDDTLLFKIQSGKPYVYFIIDTSTSMNLAPDDTWVPANGDDPDLTPNLANDAEKGAKLYQVKQALLQVLTESFQENGDTIHFGLATYNQDKLQVRGKHWLYRVRSDSGKSTDLDYPRHGSLLTFGTHFEIGTPGVAGACNAASALPANTSAEFDKIDRFAKLSPSFGAGDVLEYAPTTLWLRKGSSNLYKLTVEHISGTFGSGVLEARFSFQKHDANCSPTGSADEVVVKLDHITEFLMSDELVNNSAQFTDCEQSGG